MSETKRINAARGTNRMSRAKPATMAGQRQPADDVKESTPVRQERVAAARARVSDASYDVDKDFRNAMHKLLEGLGT